VPSRKTKVWRHHEAAKMERLVRKEIQRRQKRPPVRERDWMPGSEEEMEEWSGPTAERVMPLGERERRRALWEMAARRYNGEDSAEGEAKVAEVAGKRGVVTTISTGLYTVDLGARAALCTTRPALRLAESGFTNLVAVGDEVVVALDGNERGIIEAVLPRRSALARPDPFHRHLQQVIVANADRLLIVAAWREPAVWPELIDRYLIAAQRHNLTPMIALNKVDLASDRAECRLALQPYERLGYRVIYSSAVTGEGVEELRELLRGQTTVLAGLSGVGKSSLLQAVQPSLQLRTAEVSVRRHEGRHTTVQVTLLPLEMGGFVADTPGIREFGLAGLTRQELLRFYPELVAIAGCRFADCLHIDEPGCAVRVAVREGRASAMRYHSYKKISLSLPVGNE
jgi:ribosome biogenesis GTPase